ncbi:MAG TPA: GNAT family N-acetyltransferase [Marmoricola sp.]|nr:GNAT family N-acetyltransferase [Marmoricola sp.]
MTSSSGALARYVSAFRRRVEAMQAAGRDLVDEPGIVGAAGDPVLYDGRLLVTDDRALDVLVTQLPELRARVVLVLAAAEACQEHLAGAAGFHSEPATAMVLEDLGSVEEIALPTGLALHPVARDDGDEGVPLAAAAAAALEADPVNTPADTVGDFVPFLRGVPNARFLAALDRSGTVRATAGAILHGDVTGVFFVSTDPGWRGQGVGTAMTAAVLRSAAHDGARRAWLDSSTLGLGIYRRLGFTEVSPVTLFIHDR